MTVIANTEQRACHRGDVRHSVLERQSACRLQATALPRRAARAVVAPQGQRVDSVLAIGLAQSAPAAYQSMRSACRIGVNQSSW